MVNFSLDAVTQSQEGLDKKTYAADTRFYTLKKDENGNGAAVIRFLPSEIYENGQIRTVQLVYKYNIKSKVSKRFISEWSPQTIGKPDPIQEKWARLWNEGNKDEARRFARTARYLANIKVVKDPKSPENEGKIFLLDMSKTLYDKVNGILNPPEAEKALGATPKNLFNPLAEGYNFILKAKVAATGFTSYEDSVADANPSALYSSAEEAVKEINEKCYKLSDWDKEESYKSYEELKEMLDNIDVVTTTSNETKTEIPSEVSSVSATEVSPNQTQNQANIPAGSLDELMASLGK